MMNQPHITAENNTKQSNFCYFHKFSNIQHWQSYGYLIPLLEEDYA